MKLLLGIFLVLTPAYTQVYDLNNESVVSSSNIEPPLAPSYSRLEQMVNLITKKNSDGTDPVIDDSMLPCLLKRQGCDTSIPMATETKPVTKDFSNLTSTSKMITDAVDTLQKTLDQKTAEIVKEIERRAAEIRREIALEAEEVGEAILYLVTMLSDSIVRADHMGAGFVREWFDEASQRYIGMADNVKAPLDDETHKAQIEMRLFDNNLPSTDYEETHFAHSRNKLKHHIDQTRERYNNHEASPTTEEANLGGESAVASNEPPPQEAPGVDSNDSDHETEAARTGNLLGVGDVNFNSFSYSSERRVGLIQ